MQILDALFGRANPDVYELTYDTDVAARAQLMFKEGEKGLAAPSAELVRAILEIRAGSVDIANLPSIAMSASAIIAATSALKRARFAGQLGKGAKGTMMKRSTQRMAGILAMRAAAAAAVTGTFDGVHGADPNIVEKICQRLKAIFQSHGAVRMRSPLLRPRSHTSNATIGGPAEVINPRGVIVLLPEDLTASFGKQNYFTRCVLQLSRLSEG